jgi:hypothetical protein
MAGAGGLFVMLVGAMIGLAAGVGALLLFFGGFRRLSPASARVAIYGVGCAALLALVMTLPAWVVIFAGRGTRGESFSAGDLGLTFWMLILPPPLTLVALITRLGRRRR